MHHLYIFGWKCTFCWHYLISGIWFFLMNLLNYNNFISPRLLLCLKIWQTQFFLDVFTYPNLWMYIYLKVQLWKFGNYSRWQLFSHGQLVNNSTHRFFAYLTCNGHHFQQLWMEDNHPKCPSFPRMWIIPHLLNCKVWLLIRACMITHWIMVLLIMHVCN